VSLSGSSWENWQFLLERYKSARSRRIVMFKVSWGFAKVHVSNLPVLLVFSSRFSYIEEACFFLFCFLCFFSVMLSVRNWEAYRAHEVSLKALSKEGRTSSVSFDLDLEAGSY